VKEAMMKLCGMPEAMSVGEQRLYEKIRVVHCERAQVSHECLGRMTIDRRGVTLQCPLCGDARNIYPKVSTPQQP